MRTIQDLIYESAERENHSVLARYARLEFELESCGDEI